MNEEDEPKTFPLPLEPGTFSNVYISPRSVRSIPDKLPEFVEKRRKSIFNPELQGLIQKVAVKKNYPSIEISDELKDKISVLIPKDIDNSIKEYLRKFIHDKTFTDFAIMRYNPDFQCYSLFITEMQYADDLSFELNDPIVKSSYLNCIDMDITEKCSRDEFFRKKFSEEILYTYNKIIFYSPAKDLLLLLFHRSINLHSPEVLEELNRELSSFFSGIIPFLYAENKNESPHSAFLLEMARFESLFPRFFVTKIVLPYESGIYSDKFFSRVISLLKGEDRIFQYSSNSYYLFSKDEKNIQIEDIQTSQVTKCFPEHGKNIYIYF